MKKLIILNHSLTLNKIELYAFEAEGRRNCLSISLPMFCRCRSDVACRLTLAVHRRISDAVRRGLRPGSLISSVRL